MSRVAEYIYFRPAKVIHPFYVQIGVDKNAVYYRGVYATLEEAIRHRDRFLKCL
jgi:hypothetical protein